MRVPPISVVIVAFSTACGGNPFLDRVAELNGPMEGVLAEPLPDPILLTTSGDSVPLRSFLGEVLTLVNFGGTWCIPCAEEMPELERLHQAWADRGVAVVSVAITSPVPAIEAWIESFGLSFPIVQARDEITWAGLKTATEAGVPLTVFVDGTGTMRFFVRGYRSFEETDGRIRALLSGDEAGNSKPADPT